MPDDLTLPGQLGGGTAYDFGGTQQVAENEHWATLPDGADKWEYMLRFVERDIHSKGWDGYPQLLLITETRGAEMGALVVTQVPLPDETFRENPMMLLEAFIDILKTQPEARDKYRGLLSDSPIVGILLSTEGYGISGTEKEVMAARAEGIPFKDRPDAFESRNVVCIPRYERRFMSLNRKRGEEPEYAVMDDWKSMTKAASHSRAHSFCIQLLVEFLAMQEEAKA